MNVNRGKRIDVAIGGFTGVAGFTESDGKASLSFPASQLALRPGETVEVDERAWLVEKVGASQFLRGFKTLELRLAEST